MKIIMILTNAFNPDPRVYKEAKVLVDNGYDVEILAWDREIKFKNKQIEIIDGIKIRRIFVDGKYGSGIKQLWGYWKFIKEVVKYLKRNNSDFIHCHDFDALLVGYIAKIKNRESKLIYDEHDLFYLYFENRKGLVNRLLSILIKRIELTLMKKVDSHIVVTPNMKRLYENKVHHDSVIITNAPLKNTFRNIEKPKRERIVIGFIGVVRYFEELKLLLDVSSNFPKIEVFIGGSGPKLKEIEEYIISKKYKHVVIYGEFKLNELERIYSHIDVTYLVYPSKDAKVSLPNKFFESIVTETPMIATRGSEFGEIIKADSLGWTINYENMSKDMSVIFQDLNDNPNTLANYRDLLRRKKANYYWENNIINILGIFSKN
ncbi:glycosyltransferase [Bacillus sp. ISL-37]|uniref:glycosyltransferase n=1 Tax=Bacillus sp. ISL-37 TaxID=2819123 RepID=UPI001BE7D32C|nr:glycosyltransferase [Bacillus sp. ISL-37]MBT2686425.1 glycosyltransferase [Bacillus sp. ISL-37]